MSTNHTTNYNLNQWLATDQVKRTEFNEDNSKIDAALKANADAIAANTAAVAEHAATLLEKGNCQIYTTTYAGDGNASRTFTFPGAPLLLCTTGPSFQLMAVGGNPYVLASYSGTFWGLSATWNGVNLTLAYTGTFAGGDSKMGNESGSTYYMVALIAADE